MANDEPTVFEAAPARYTTKYDRETIDRQRDMAAVWMEEAFQARLSFADSGFYVGCRMCIMRYDDRYGLKDAPEKEQVKIRFYTMMCEYLMGRGADPRSERVDFKPYKRVKVKAA